MLKVLATELSQTLTELAMEAAGPRGRAYQPHATRPGGPVSEFEPPPDGYVSGEPWQAVRPNEHQLEDIRSLVAYLRSIPAQATDLPRTVTTPAPASYKEGAVAEADARGEKVFAGACASRHAWTPFTFI